MVEKQLGSTEGPTKVGRHQFKVAKILKTGHFLKNFSMLEILE